MESRELNIRQVPTTVNNNEASSIYERMYKTCGDEIKNLVHKNPRNTTENKLDMEYEVIAPAQCALRLSKYITMGVAPGTMVFGRYMLLTIPVLTDFNIIDERRQLVTDDNNC